jgi:hypothetical protein
MKRNTNITKKRQTLIWEDFLEVMTTAVDAEEEATLILDQQLTVQVSTLHRVNRLSRHL